MNRRGFRRNRHRLRVRLEPGGINTMTGNLSPGGTFVFSHRILKPGTRVRFEVELPGGTTEAEGIVRWAKRVPPALASLGRGGMGIEFTWVTEELRLHLENTKRVFLRAV